MLDEDDLSGVVRNVQRSRAEATKRFVNHPLTRAYLEAGVRLVERELRAADTDGQLTRPFETLRRENVIAELANGRRELPIRGTVGSFRDRWDPFSGYLSDLARFMLRMRQSGPVNTLVRQATVALSDGDFAAVVHEVAYRDMLLAAQSIPLRFRFLAMTLAAQDQAVAEAMTTVYHDITHAWKSLCDEVFAARGLTLRPGLTTDDLATILVALNEGLALRTANEPDHTFRDDETRHGLLGQAALALFAAFVDKGDHSTLEELAERIAGGKDA
ncbi:hypothetical protein [Actinocrispum wychmicini]|uniref:TetR family transcriptional regulator n=1 Tax=Actinocrispum wychmicini TaxID=1213861 RepID=A0A4R2JTX7_9PSEU|nr:hypothetical protein [Actinocrispum wychmicini]TCO60449.1 hypothetical protein EV192_10324 [Actinocrispum wychmicini]